MRGSDRRIRPGIADPAGFLALPLVEGHCAGRGLPICARLYNLALEDVGEPMAFNFNVNFTVRRFGLQKYHFDSFAKSLKTVVLACDQLPPKFSFDGPVKAKKKGKKAAASPTTPSPTHILRVADTVLFAEGGGQPYDMGLVNGSIPVLRVLRPANAKPEQKVASQEEIGDVYPLHYIQMADGQALAPGDEVELSVDWPRREYHMQQHSAQHLISAIAERRFGWQTSSWWLGAEKSNIEFLASDAEKPVTAERLAELEDASNASIRNADKVEVRVEEAVEVEEAGDDSSDRKSKTRHQGKATRIVEIGGGAVDSNQCCGTHVAHTGQLQCVKFLGSEPARGQTRIFFVAGIRAMQVFREVVDREAAMTATLCTRAEEHVELVAKLQQESRAAMRLNKALQIEVAQFVAEAIVADLKKREGQKVVGHHRDVGDIAFATLVANAVLEEVPEAVCLLTCGNAPAVGKKPQDGIFLIACSKESSINLPEVGKAAAAAMKGRGGGRAPKFQGKAEDLAGREEALRLLEAAV